MGESLSTTDSSNGTVENILQHFGVRGMKWGVRRSRKELDASPDHVRATEIKKKARLGKTHRLSNEELQTAITRMQLETQYRNLKRNNRGEADKFVQDLLKEQGKTVIREATKKYGPKLLKMVATGLAARKGA